MGQAPSQDDGSPMADLHRIAFQPWFPESQVAPKADGPANSSSAPSQPLSASKSSSAGSGPSGLRKQYTGISFTGALTGADDEPSSGLSFGKALTMAKNKSGSIGILSRYHQLPVKLEDHYEWSSQELGVGMNGSVCLMHHRKTGARCAVKRFKLRGLSKDNLNAIASELLIFLAMDHPHVARLLDVYESDRNLDLVMECMNGGPMFDRMVAKKKYTELDAATSTQQMLLAVNYLHSHKVVHRDLKLENFLYETAETDHLKLIDFGLSKVFEDGKADATRMKTALGTLAYIAPEILSRSYTSQCDLWSLGIIVFIILFGYMPFNGTEKDMLREIKAGRYRVKPGAWAKVSESARDFVRNLLQLDPAIRLTAKQALAHPWVSQRESRARVDSMDQATVDALVNFSQASRFRRACMTVMAWSLSNEERGQVRDAFIALDVEQTGTISVLEFKKVLEDQFKIEDEKVVQAFDALESMNHHDEIHYSDFLAAMISHRIDIHEELLQATFRHFDTNSAGCITADGLKHVLGDEFDEAELAKIMSEVDASHSGSISLHDFIQYFSNGKGDERHAEAIVEVIDQRLPQVTDQKLPRTFQQSETGEEPVEKHEKSQRRSLVVLTPMFSGDAPLGEDAIAQPLTPSPGIALTIDDAPSRSTIDDDNHGTDDLADPSISNHVEPDPFDIWKCCFGRSGNLDASIVGELDADGKRPPVFDGARSPRFLPGESPRARSPRLSPSDSLPITPHCAAGESPRLTT